MKKMFAIVLALVLALSTVSALAATEINWADYEAGVAEIDARFVTFDEISIKVWVPNVMQENELADEYKEAGFIGFYSTPDDACWFTVQYVDVNGISLEEYAASLAEDADVSGIEMITVNGIPALNYDVASEDATVLAFATQMGHILQFTFAPVSDEGYGPTVRVMAASIDSAE